MTARGEMKTKDCGCGLNWDRKRMNVKSISYCPTHALAPELVASLRAAETRLRSIYDMINDEVDDKIRGQRVRHSRGLLPQINEEALAGSEDARALLARLEG